VSFNTTSVCAKFAAGQFAAFSILGPAAAPTGGEIVLAVPYTGSPALQNTAAQVAGKVIVMQRGASSFQDKAERAQAAGAVGVIIVNNLAGDPTLMSGNFSGINIPVVMVPMSVDGALQASQGRRLTMIVNRPATVAPTNGCDCNPPTLAPAVPLYGRGEADAFSAASLAYARTQVLMRVQSRISTPTHSHPCVSACVRVRMCAFCAPTRHCRLEALAAGIPLPVQSAPLPTL
jgi:hypothetical protein